MNYDEFISEVQKKTGNDSHEETKRIVKATLETLGERLEETELRRLAAQLPQELKEYLSERQDTPHIYDLEEFYNRMSARANIGYPEAVRAARGVMAALCMAVTEGEIFDVFGKIPDRFRELFGKDPEGALSPTMDSSEFRTRKAQDPQIESPCPE